MCQEFDIFNSNSLLNFFQLCQVREVRVSLDKETSTNIRECAVH
jgi:hypothetical protein